MSWVTITFLLFILFIVAPLMLILGKTWGRRGGVAAVAVPATGAPWWAKYVAGLAVTCIAVWVGITYIDPGLVGNVAHNLEFTMDSMIIVLFYALILVVLAYGLHKRNSGIIVFGLLFIGFHAFFGTDTIQTLQRNAKWLFGVEGYYTPTEHASDDAAVQDSRDAYNGKVLAPTDGWSEVINVNLGQHVEFGNASQKGKLRIQYRLPGDKRWKDYIIGTSPEMTGLRFRSLTEEAETVAYSLSAL